MNSPVYGVHRHEPEHFWLKFALCLIVGALFWYAVLS
jgi:hypothetical protein